MWLQFVIIISLDENTDENEYMSFIIGAIHWWLTTKLLLQLHLYYIND